MIELVSRGARIWTQVLPGSGACLLLSQSPLHEHGMREKRDYVDHWGLYLNRRLLEQGSWPSSFRKGWEGLHRLRGGKEAGQAGSCVCWGRYRDGMKDSRWTRKRWKIKWTRSQHLRGWQSIRWETKMVGFGDEGWEVNNGTSWSAIWECYIDGWRWEDIEVTLCLFTVFIYSG